jgi:hypothetical protein
MGNSNKINKQYIKNIFIEVDDMFLGWILELID